MRFAGDCVRQVEGFKETVRGQGCCWLDGDVHCRRMRAAICGWPAFCGRYAPASLQPAANGESTGTLWRRKAEDRQASCQRRAGSAAAEMIRRDRRCLVRGGSAAAPASRIAGRGSAGSEQRSGPRNGTPPRGGSRGFRRRLNPTAAANRKGAA